MRRGEATGRPREDVMFRFAIIVSIITLASACKGQAPTGSGEPGPDEVASTGSSVTADRQPEQTGSTTPETPAQEVATYKVPQMDDELVKELTGSLSRHKGVVSARADTEGGLFHVTFRPGESSPDDIGRALAAVDAGIVLEGVKAAGAGTAAAPHDCGSCPMKHTCDKTH